MGRLVDKAQYELQEKERALCAHLNTLAMALLGTAGKAAAGAGKEHKGSGGGEEGEPGGPLACWGSGNPNKINGWLGHPLGVCPLTPRCRWDSGTSGVG